MASLKACLIFSTQCVERNWVNSSQNLIWHFCCQNSSEDSKCRWNAMKWCPHPTRSAPCSIEQNICEKIRVHLLGLRFWEKARVRHAYLQYGEISTAAISQKRSGNLPQSQCHFVLSALPLLSPLWQSSPATEITPLEEQAWRRGLRQQAY